MGGLDSLTVVELKQRLKDKGLPVSGKKAELIARLELEDDFIYLKEEEEVDNVPEVKKSSEDKVEMNCFSCDVRIKVPSDYSGKVKCPACNSSFRVSEVENPSDPFRSLLLRVRGGLVEKENFLWSHFWFGFFAPLVIVGASVVATNSLSSAAYYYNLLPYGCFLAPIFGIVLLFYGHSIGDRALYQGVLAGFVVAPVILFLLLILSDPFAGVEMP